MKTINLLLASTDRQASNLVQAAVLDACYNQAAVETIRTSRVDELMALGSREGIDLIVITPGKLQAAPKSITGLVSPAEVAEGVQTLKRYHMRPVLVVDVRAQDEPLFRDAGADAVFCFPFDGTILKQRVNRVLKLKDTAETIATFEKPSIITLLLRGFQRFKSA